MSIQNHLRYFISGTVDGNNYNWEAAPLGEAGLNMSIDKSDESGVISYEKKLTGELKFVDEDYRILKSLEVRQENVCIVLDLDIQEQISGEWTSIVGAKIALAKGTWDDDKCVFSIEPYIESIEKQMLSDKEVDLFALIKRRVLVVADNKYNENLGGGNGIQWENEYHESKGCTRNPDDLPAGWTRPPGYEDNASYDDPGAKGYEQQREQYWEDYGPWVSFPSGNNAVTWRCRHSPGTDEYRNRERCIANRWHRYVAWISDNEPVPEGAVDLNEQASGKKKIALKPTYSETWIDESTGQRLPPGQKPEMRERGQCRDGYEMNRGNPIGGPMTGGYGYSTEIFDNGLKLEDVMIAVSSIYALTPVSKFFNINQETGVSDINYVTGKRSTTNFIVLFQKSDIKRPNASNRATIFKVKFKDLIGDLCKMFNCRWAVVGSDLIIEHVSYFQTRGEVNLTETPELKGKGAYTYISADYPNREMFTFMDKSPERHGLSDFNGVDITYNNCKKENIDDAITAERTTTDVGYLIDVGKIETENQSTNERGETVYGGAEVSDDGMCLIACTHDYWKREHNDVHNVITLPAKIGLYSQLNNSAGWAWLHELFYMYDRNYRTGIMNNEPTEFITTKPVRQSIDLTYTYCERKDMFNELAQFYTPSGIGRLNNAKLNLSRGTVTIRVDYGQFNPANWAGTIYASYEEVPYDSREEEFECPDGGDGTDEYRRERKWKIIRMSLYYDKEKRYKYFARQGQSFTGRIRGEAVGDTEPDDNFTLTINEGQASADSEVKLSSDYLQTCDGEWYGYQRAYTIESINDAEII